MSSCASADDELVFITTDAQLLRFAGIQPSARRAAPAAASPAYGSPPGAGVLYFGAVDAGSSTTS